MANRDQDPAGRHPMQPDPAATPLATRRLPYSTGVWDRDEIDAVVRVLEGPRESLVIGANVAEFEEQVAALFGKQYGG
jgi:dTDP-4-amino-4,6-dideoxygalactose transaminase